jgi:hypothetical protein
MSATRFLRKIAHPTVRQPRFVFDALHVAEFYFYFRLAWLGHVSRVVLCIMIAVLLFTLRGTYTETETCIAVIGI